MSQGLVFGDNSGNRKAPRITDAEGKSREKIPNSTKLRNERPADKNTNRKKPMMAFVDSSLVLGHRFVYT